MIATTTTDALVDLETLCLNLGQLHDPELVKRVQDRAREVRERIYRENGLLNVAVELVRESRKES